MRPCLPRRKQDGPSNYQRRRIRTDCWPLRWRGSAAGSNFCDGQVRIAGRPIYSACVSIERDHRRRFPNIFLGHCPTPTCCPLGYPPPLLHSPPPHATFVRSVFVLPPKIPRPEMPPTPRCIIRCDHSRNRPIVCFRARTVQRGRLCYRAPCNTPCQGTMATRFADETRVMIAPRGPDSRESRDFVLFTVPLLEDVG